MKTNISSVQQNSATLTAIINQISGLKDGTEEVIRKILVSNPASNGDLFSKSKVLDYFHKNDTFKNTLTLEQQHNFLKLIRKKKVRTSSGVTPVTVLTKPFPCPGKCIFCPNDVRMPKSYLSDEPGAQRAESNKFDPYLQTYNRLTALKNIGHPVEKIELIVLGGTWTFYPREYQIWFIKRCFDAMNEFVAETATALSAKDLEFPLEEVQLEEIYGEDMKKSYNHVIAKALAPKNKYALQETATWEQLYEAHKINETAKTRCIGLVVETRPDEINEEELIHLRKLGSTKVQIGIQSLDDEVLTKNKRGHDVKTTQNAVSLIRQAGFKIHAHWMPNLYGASPESDIEDFKRLFTDKNIRPDELKIYPCSLIESAELMKYYKSGEWVPYTYDELLMVLAESIKDTPRYCRLTRIIRDIPSTDIVVGNKLTNFRQTAEAYLQSKNIILHDIRSREIRQNIVTFAELELKVTEYDTSVSKEYFLEYVDKTDKIAGFLRLSLPTVPAFIPELVANAIIREVHVYGDSLELGDKKQGVAQHIGLGKGLIEKAKEISKLNSFQKLSVISSVGTRNYYKKLGFEFGDLYQHLSL